MQTLWIGVLTIWIGHGAWATSCDDGWESSGTHCYLYVEDFKADVHAALEHCNQRDSVLAYPFTQAELTYLTSAVKKRNVYGWWLGYKSTTRGMNEFPNKRGKWVAQRADVPIIHIPTSQTTDVSGCWTMFTGGETELEFTPEPCNVKLPYICTGNPTNANIPKTALGTWKITSDLVVYISSVNHLVSYNDAKKECTGMGLDLMKISDRTFTYISEKVKLSFESPGAWWTSLTKTDTTFKWGDGTAVDSSVVIQGEFKNGVFKWMLKASGLARFDKHSSKQRRPFICQKSALDAYSNFGCPASWYRGGQSCYHVTWRTPLSQTDAEKQCKDYGAHLLTIDSRDEKVYMEESTFLASYGQGHWTSLNDKQKEGVFVWGDGTALDTKLIRWLGSYGRADSGSLRRSKLAKTGQLCGVFVPDTGELLGVSCDSAQLPGCQYALPEGQTTCVNDGWQLFDGHCYYTGTQKMTNPFFANIAICDALLTSAHGDIKGDYIKVYSKTQVEFLSRTFSKRVWLGLTTQFSPPVLLWTDGTQPDFDLFPNALEPNNGLGKGEQDCVQIFNGGGYTDENCDDKAAYICEKELTFEAQSLGGGAAENKFKVYLPITLVLATYIIA